MILSGLGFWLVSTFGHFLSGLAPSRFAKIQNFCPDRDQTVSAIDGGPNRGMLRILVNIFQFFINIVQCYIVVKRQAFVTSPSKAIFKLFSREMLLLLSEISLVPNQGY